MLAINTLYLILLFLIALFTLLLGVLNDLRAREVSSYLFVPLFISALILYSYYGASPWFLGISSGFFVLTFFRLKPLMYASGGIFLLALGIISGQAEFVLYFMVLFLTYIIGTGEKFYGIGDIKALIALSFAFVSPLKDAFTITQYPLLTYIPFNFILLINTALFSVLFIPYLVIVNYRKTKTFRTHYLYAMDYDEELYNEHPERYRLADLSGERIMVYGAPSLVPIYLGFLVTFIFGLWFA